jgi:cysteine-rich repeat protein
VNNDRRNGRIARSTAWLMGTLAAFGLVAATAATGCSGDRAGLGRAEDELSAEQCTYFASGDRVTVCHRTSSARNPYTIIRTSSAGCAAGHAGHLGDYIASTDPASDLYDPTCNGMGCFPVGAPYDGSVECCEGLEPVGGVCTDIDECATATDNCDANAACTNTIGGFTCACNEGFTGDGVTCTDVDECTDGTATCGANSTCTNTPGAYTCACDPGYAGDATGRDCQNIDDCAAAPCHNGGTCTDGIQAFTCTCAPGYVGDTCDLTVCGDGIVIAGEQCDDGNNVDGDGCSAACGIEARCGDGIVTAGEECDDGNNIDGDGCSATCRAPVCGDGVVNQPSELCDRGAQNGVAGSGCEADCTLEVGVELSLRIHEHCDPNSVSILFTQDTQDLNWPANLNPPSYVTLDAHTGVIVYSGLNFTGDQRTFVNNTNFCGVSYPSGAGINDNVRSLQLFLVP